MKITLTDIPDVIAAFLPPSVQLEWPEQGMTADVAFASNGYQSVVLKRCSHPI